MSQSKNPQLPSDDQPQVDHPSGDPMPSAKTVEEADPKKKSTYPVRWEYHTMRIQDTAMRLPADELDALGDQGWEMIAIYHLHATINFIFKRFVLDNLVAKAQSGVEELEKK